MSQPASVSELQFRILGPLAVPRADDDQVTIASRPQRRPLAGLALHVGAVVGSASLEERLTLSPGTLRRSVSRLRRVIGVARSGTGPQTE